MRNLIKVTKLMGLSFKQVGRHFGLKSETYFRFLKRLVRNTGLISTQGTFQH